MRQFVARWTAMPSLACLLLAGAAFGQNIVADREPVRQDGRFTERLEWTSPHGELPGTLAEYLQRHPLCPAEFGGAQYVPGAALRSTRMISILVDATLAPQITPALNLYVADLEAEGYGVYAETVSGGTPTDIKAWVQGRYDAGSEGVVFIGDITAAWAEVSGAVFPSDLFYMDLDGHWDDADVDGDYEVHTAGGGDEGPELYVARIYAHTLSYDSEANMVSGYLAKSHAYHRGTLTQPWRGLEYVDEDWFSMTVNLADIYGDDVVRHDYGYFTTAADYLANLDLTQHFVQVCAHSYSGGHHFGMRPTECASYAHTYVYSPTARAARLLVGSDDGVKVWLNGSNVLTVDFYGAWAPDRYTKNVSLNAGWNRLLCKVSQDGGDHKLSARFSDLGGVTFDDLTYQVNDPNAHGEDTPHIRGWLLNGFHQDSSDNFWSYLNTNYLGTSEGALNPLEGDSHGGQTWTRHSSSAGFVDLGPHCGGADFGVCYAFVRVYADSAKSCQLWLGYDDGAKVYLNGTTIVNHNRYGDYIADMSKVNVNLLAGENRLLVKISEWMGTHGFSGRFAHPDGTAVAGLSYDPLADPISYIGNWLLNGPYVNPDVGTRLSQDYLGGEGGVRPSEGDPAPFGAWEQAVTSGYPVDVGAFFDRDGGWVYSQTIQDRDPPVLFYNLFSCGPGRFTDDDYLAGAYIFNTSWGLITVASSKSGSMLNFQDFTAPLGAGESLGTAFHAWFDAQAPFELWEREWYYGMVLNGDPTLRPISLSKPGDMDCDGSADFGDINPFVQALIDDDVWHAEYPDCPIHNGDLNGDGQFDFGDINPFVDLLLR